MGKTQERNLRNKLPRKINRETTNEEDEDVEKHWISLKTDINNIIENTVGFKWKSVSRKSRRHGGMRS